MRERKVPLSKMMEEMKLTYATPEIELEGKNLMVPEINRPALQLAGYFTHFMNHRVQIIGYVEHSFLEQLEGDKCHEAYEAFVSKGVPCVVFTQGKEPSEELLSLSRKYEVPVFTTERETSPFTAEITRWLNVQLAPMISIHGVLVDVFGEGVLIMGESGIGKSETALELVKRGHRLVSDDVVEISRVSDVTLVGTAPDITRHFIELRGIGIIDVKTLFGVQSVENTKAIDLVIQLEEYDKDKQYDRLGMEETYTEILGNKVVSHAVPIRPGRNLAVIVETTAINRRQKKMGYNAAQELYRRVQENLASKKQS